MKIENKPFEILDLVLKQLKESTEDTPKMQNDLFTDEQLQNISKRDRAIIFEKLEGDKYITKREMPIDKINTSKWTGWYISFDGVIFLYLGGYQGKEHRDNLHQDGLYNIQKMTEDMQKRMLFLTWVLAVSSAITALYYLYSVFCV